MGIINKISYGSIEFSYGDILKKLITCRPKKIKFTALSTRTRSKRKRTHFVELEYHPFQSARKDGRDYIPAYDETIFITFVKRWTFQLKYNTNMKNKKKRKEDYPSRVMNNATQYYINDMWVETAVFHSLIASSDDGFVGGGDHNSSSYSSYDSGSSYSSDSGGYDSGGYDSGSSSFD